MNIIRTLVLALLFISAPLFAEEAEETPAKPSLSASRSVTVMAEVEAIDHETRVVTLLGEDGSSHTFTASDAARNLGQVEVGDMVIAEFYEDITISVHAGEGMEAEAAEIAAMARTQEGEMPGGMVMDTQIITATVEAIDLENNTFKLKGPDGNVKEFVARNPDNLRRSEVGDIVVITITQAVGIMVERPQE